MTLLGLFAEPEKSSTKNVKNLNLIERGTAFEPEKSSKNNVKKRILIARDAAF